MSSREMVALLETLDVEGMRRFQAKTTPGMPELDAAETLAAIHLARTKSELVRFGLRAYSHAWLLERGYPSLLPDKLKPKAQRLYPVTVMGVGIAVRSKFEEVKTTITNAMSDAVLEAEADKKLADSPYVKARMMEARQCATKKLFG